MGSPTREPFGGAMSQLHGGERQDGLRDSRPPWSADAPGEPRRLEGLSPSIERRCPRGSRGMTRWPDFVLDPVPLRDYHDVVRWIVTVGDYGCS
mgnify:CR=1 FL=1